MADISKITLPSNDEYNIKDATARSGLATKQDTLVSGTNIKTINNESLLGSGNITIQGGGDSLPDQTGHSGDILTTNGTAASWMDVSEASSVSIDTSISSSSTDNTIPSSKAVWDALSSIDALPDQTGNSGKFLTTDGTDASWANVPEEIFIATYGTTTYVEVEAAYNAGKALFVQNGTKFATFFEKTSTTFYFRFIDGTSSGNYRVTTSGWAYGNANLVSTSRTVNNKALSSDITLEASDVGAQPTITASGILKGDGSGTITAATAGTDYLAPPSSPSNGNVLTYNGSSWVASAPSGGLPSQTGNSGKYLTTNGTTASWGAASATSTKSIDNSPTSASSNLVTSGGVYTAINNKVNRTTAVNVADTNYTTLMARGVVMLDGTTYDAVSDWSTYLVNGAIAWRYE